MPTTQQATPGTVVETIYGEIVTVISVGSTRLTTNVGTVYYMAVTDTNRTVPIRARFRTHVRAALGEVDIIVSDQCLPATQYRVGDTVGFTDSFNRDTAARFDAARRARGYDVTAPYDIGSGGLIMAIGRGKYLIRVYVIGLRGAYPDTVHVVATDNDINGRAL